MCHHMNRLLGGPTLDHDSTVGKLVWYTDSNSKVRPALITGILADTVALHIFPGGKVKISAAFTDQPAGTIAARGKWTWPKRSS